MGQRKGFTLVELSVVIVLIGLIVSGVVGGAALLRQAKVRTVIADYNKYNTAVNAFKLEYSELPGDLSNAASYGIGTSGNGDRRIHPTNTENLDFWQHLSQSGIIERAYTGTAPPLVAGNNVPVSSFGGDVVIHVGHLALGGASCLAIGGSTLFGTEHNAHVFAFGSIDPTTGWQCPNDGFLKVSEASGIDNKIDDGEPDSGIMYSINHSNTNTDGNRCVDIGVNQSGNVLYDYDETGETCRVWLKFTL